ncbi:MAG: DegT/DnrJ/EryC1/StrS family aminotransferase [Candidatus Marinimicrobia bacterium]|nr:DegT/DnrJ/EryC1/StrS family aminotransferase [Candidatus Neomarinimicrobiota bacterium]
MTNRKIEVPFVDLKAQYESIKDDISTAINDVIALTSFIGGPYVKQFEEDFSQFCSAAHVIGVGNGTDAITIALRALNLNPGFEAIIPANTFIATSEAVTAAGGVPVFCDVDLGTYLLDLEKAQTLISKNTRVIIPVHLYGQMMDMRTVQSFASTHDLFIIEDAAQAHGAVYDKIRIGECSHFTAYSFYPGKNLGAYGDAGALSTDHDELAQRARMWANHGRTQKYDHEFEGYNSRLDGLQAAILSAKLRYLPEWISKRVSAANYYRQLLQGLDVVLPTEVSEGSHVYHLFVVLLDDRDHIRSELAQAGISSGIHYPIALPFLKAYKKFRHRPEDFPVAYELSQKVLSLPIYPEITKEQIEYVVEVLKGHL